MHLNPHNKLLGLWGGLLIAMLPSVTAYAAGNNGVHGVNLAFDAPWQNPVALEAHIYIVQLDTPPAVAFDRDQNSATGERNTFDIEDPEIQRYVADLQTEQSRLLEKLQVNEKPIYNYSYAFNGFAVRMTEAQAIKLRSQKGVAGVWKDQLRYVSTADSPEFLGLNDPQAGLAAALGLTGEDVIIGVIDSGIAIDHPSFSDTAGYADINSTVVIGDTQRRKPRGLCGQSFIQDTLLGDWLCGKIWRRYEEQTFAATPPRWVGICQTVDGFDSSQCNNKLIGARYYKSGFDAESETDPDEFLSPRDADGHGTHIASIAAGNQTDASIGGSFLGQVQGMAPRARIAVYKACWLQPGQTRASCSFADLQSAIEDAVADGVDIINFSIGDPNPGIDDPDDRALLAAAEAGVLTVAAAGNEGPDPGGINSPGSAPWVLTVGASSREGEEFDSAITVNSPADLAGDYLAVEAAFTPPLNSFGTVDGALILADDDDLTTPAGDPGTTYDACSPLVNGAELNGNVALVVRGGCDFEVKVFNAERAGALGVLIYNDEAAPFLMQSNDNLVVNIPALSLGQADGQFLRDALMSAEAIDVTLDSSIFVGFVVDGNEMASFSSRGPNAVLSNELADFIKPDLTAPGINILAGQTPDVANGVQGELFQYLSGTSMSTPHVTGIAALVKQAYPNWGLDQLKSALMTTARQNIVKEDGSTPADPFDFGAGHIDANKTVQPGLVYPLASEDYDAYLCGTRQPRLTQSQCQNLRDRGFSTEAYNLNLPSIGVSGLAGTITVKRRVTNTGPAGSFSVTVENPAGITIDVEPSLLSLQSGETAEFAGVITNQSNTQYDWLFGAISWSNGTVIARSPVAVRPVVLSAPVELPLSGASGSALLPIQFGYSGAYAPKVSGFNAPCVLPDSDLEDDVCTNLAAASIEDDPDNLYELRSDPTPPSISRQKFKVASNQLLLRVQLFNEFTAGDDDLDLYLYKCTDGEACTVATLEAASENEASNEVINVYNPLPGYWFVDVHAFDTSSPLGTEFRLHTWQLGRNNDVGNLQLDNAPPAVGFGDSANLELSWSNLSPDIYLGGISHSDNLGIPAESRLTLIPLDARAP